MLLLLLVTNAEAKDLRSRVGIGFHEQFGDTTSISLRYGLPASKPTMNVQLELDVGLDVSTKTTSWFAGGRLLAGVVAEDNMNLYLGVGAGYLGGPGNLRIEPAIGAQFFLFGLENLGFSAEFGVDLDFGSSFAFKTIGAGPAAAVHYYF